MGVADFDCANKKFIFFFSLFSISTLSKMQVAPTLHQIKINDIKVKPIIPDGGEPDASKIKGYDFIPMLYSNIFLCAKKKSGKTNLLFTLLSELVNKDTEVFIFCSSVYKDKTYEEIIKMLNKKKVVHEIHTSFIDSQTGESIVDEIIHEEDAKREAEEMNKFNPPKRQGPKFLELSDDKKAKTKATGPKAAERIFVFDDLGSELRHPSINQLLKTNRHNKCKVLLSSQYLTDLQPQAIKQLDFVFMFKSFNEEKLKSMYELLDISIPFDQFVTLYKFSTAEPFNFLFIDVRHDSFHIFATQ